MANHKLLLEDDFEDDFSIIAIHCNEEPYKVAFLLNKYANLRLERKRRDLDFSKKGLEITFPMYEFVNGFQYKHFNLVGNKCKSREAYVMSSGGLFGESETENIIISYLLPEFKQVDYLLKLNEEEDSLYFSNLLLEINNIEHVITAYKIELDNIKSIKNLIFE